MANPKKRRTKAAVGRNRAHLALKKVTLNACPKCGKAVKPHTACSFCGEYKGRTALKVKSVVKNKKK